MNRLPWASTNASGKFALNTGTNDGSLGAAAATQSSAADTARTAFIARFITGVSLTSSSQTITIAKAAKMLSPVDNCT